MSAAGADNVNDNGNENVNGNNIVFTIKDTKLYAPAVTLSVGDNQNFLAKDLQDQFIRMNIKQKVRIKLQQMNIDILSKQILLESIDYLNRENDVELFTKRHNQKL